MYLGGTGARVESNIYPITGSAVVKLPSFARLQLYALAGGGALIFDPTGNTGGQLRRSYNRDERCIRLWRRCRLRFH